jgi:hypothetical protein
MTRTSSNANVPERCRYQDDRIQELEEQMSALSAQISSNNIEFAKATTTLENYTQTAGDVMKALKGDDKNPGFFEQVRTMQRTMSAWDDARKWLTRLVLGVLTVEAIGLVWFVIELKAKGPP